MFLTCVLSCPFEFLISKIIIFLFLSSSSFYLSNLPVILTPSLCVHAKLLESCLTLCNPMNFSLPGFSVHGILQTRILEWAALLQRILPTQESNPCLLRLLPWQASSLPLLPPGKPLTTSSISSKNLKGNTLHFKH